MFADRTLLKYFPVFFLMFVFLKVLSEKMKSLKAVKVFSYVHIRFFVWRKTTIKISATTEQQQKNLRAPAFSW